MKVVKYGLYDIREEREETKDYILQIHEDIASIKHSFIKLGFHLNEIKNCLYYEDAGYVDFYEFCESNYQMDKSAVSRYINLWYRFCMINKPSGMRTMFIDKKYENYSYSQLSEMLVLSEKECENVTSQMTIKEIRAYKKSLKQPRVVDDEEVATSQLERFSYKEFDNKIGINKAHYLRRCMKDGIVNIKIVDKNGRVYSKQVHLANDENGYVFYLDDVLENMTISRKQKEG